MPIIPTYSDCTPKCRSTAHYLDLIRVASQSAPAQIILSYLCRCGNCAKGHDKYGRTLTQVCSALTGKWPIIDWLIKQRKIDINTKNSESGYTALHYSVFYGIIDNTVNLIKAGANTCLLDFDHMTYIDHVIRDTYVNMNIELSSIESYEVYTMGENINGSLGHSQSTAKKVPELIDFFRRQSICITKVKMDKYHTLFLSNDGSVYSCGFGIGGRLGHDNEDSILIPKQILAMETIRQTEQDYCIDIVVTRDCSYFLTFKGNLWSCGLNNYHQLGHPGTTKLLIPTKVQFRQVKDRKITHIACGRFHVALIVDDTQLFTFGLNAGHLGHPKGNDLYVQQPLLVTKFNSQSEHIDKLVCNDSVTICYTNKGDIYLLNDYKYRKIVKHVLNITQIAVVGGRIELNGVLDEENIDEDLKIFYIQSKKLYLYHEREAINNRPKLCLWTTKQRLTIEHIAVGMYFLIFSTNTGQVYTASLDKLSNINKKIDNDLPINSIYDERLYQYLTPSPVPLIHRCRGLATDRTGRSLAALQYYPTTYLSAYPRHPKSNFHQDLQELLNNAEHTHDITLEINNNQTFYAHKYILSMRSPYFRERLSNKTLDYLTIANETTNYIDPDIFQLILEYIYVDQCPWLNIVRKIKLRNEKEYEAYLAQMKNIDDDIDDHRYFARTRQQNLSISANNKQQQHGTKSKKKKKAGNTSPSNEILIEQQNEEELNSTLERLLELARLFQLVSLRKRLEMIKQSRQKNSQFNDESIGDIKKHYYYNRDALSDLHDVTIISEDGIKISCHKCILTSRLEYFRGMFLANWIENQTNSEFKMAIPFDLLKIIIEYLYTDNITNKFTVEQLCQILVLSDQLLIERLKQICEFHIANLVTFRDAAELLQFSITYNASQLQAFVEQFICQNMATFLDARLLDNLDNDVLSNLGKAYRNLLDCMSYRKITPYSDCPMLDDISIDIDEIDNLSIDIDETMKKHQYQQKRKQQNRLRTSESESTNKTSPPLSVEQTSSLTPPARVKKMEEEKWTSVSSKKSSKNTKAIHSPATSNSPPKPTIPGAVYSQQEADKLAAAKKVVNLDISTNKSTIKQSTAQLPISKPTLTAKDDQSLKNPWKITTVPPPVSLKSTFSLEKESKPITTTRPTSTTQSTRSIPIVQPPPPPQHDVTNPWSSFATSPTSSFPMAYSNTYIASSPPTAPISFKHIQDQETRAHEALRLISNKSLEKIQTEELAIQALHRLYNTCQEFDMFITIERVVPEIANPIWPRTTAPAVSSSSPSLVLITQKKGQK